MDENLNQQNWGGANNNARPTSPPPPPPPEITLRTMKSDLDSIKQTGGENPVPKPFTPPEIKQQSNMEMDDMIKPGNGDGIVPPVKPSKSKFKVFLLVFILILVIAGAGFAGYKYIYPMFKAVSSNVPVVTEPPVIPPQNVIPEPLPQAPTPEPVSPMATTSMPGTPTTTPEFVEIPPVKILKPHVSLLVTPADLSAPLNLASTSPMSLATIKEVLTSESANKPATATALKEVILSNDNGQLVFADVLPMFLSNFNAGELATLFEEDFTSVIFYDSNGAWFGLVAKLRAGTDPVLAKNLMAKLEQSVDLVNLYMQNPGTSVGSVFKDGSANKLPVRYLNFSKAGASLDYGWTNSNLFVISTSYNGMKAILTKLGVQ